MRRIDLWSSGGGVQSTAIAVLILQGKLPKPDLACIADTEREKQSTWDYLHSVTEPALAAFGVKIHRIKKSDWRAPDLYDRQDEKLLLPVWTDINGPLGKKETWCSTEWKRDVIRRWANAQVTVARPQFRVWMGMSYDEPKRIKPTVGKWEPWYPLFEMRLRRADCIRLILGHGWPMPVAKSACWQCPHHQPEDWQAMQREQPEEFEKACILDEQIRDRDGDVYVHEYGKPLREAVNIPIEKAGVLGDFKAPCNTSHCFV